jgi:hypothetical protein
MAHFGLGQRGTFTEVSQYCGQRTCVWRGNFAPDNNGPVRQDVPLEDGGNAPGPVGSQVPAVYALGLVYSHGGGPGWITTPLLLVIEVGALVGGAIFWRRRRRRRRQAAVPARLQLTASAL